MESGLKEVSDRIDRIRDAISRIDSLNPRFQEFSRYCATYDLRPRRFQTDMPVTDIRNKLFKEFSIYGRRFDGVET
ncbi:hypothetical protein Ddye_007814 [Dipteronia dyeriana]|uniref:Uncharacterized protein n=1 Tax=Dipteronia dyeriana TaxID=168575 RepID=A0AAD9XL62_9ROSI|nr:hypothetical protein Ddye_007814 [Dipteronia dyeriana]